MLPRLTVCLLYGVFMRDAIIIIWDSVDMRSISQVVIGLATLKRIQTKDNEMNKR